ncbi:serine hydrolase [uncultured Chitinophaga sp.]|uniref:serine hydrolase n=1 Tax=uncultured Chitinophaga sp. TaxID=339340 RepID=UPI0025D08DFF|nr:serine hydrolase [uncultured Chitinophaga sp.]
MKKTSALLLLFSLVTHAYAQNLPAKLDSVLNYYDQHAGFNGSALIAYKGQVWLSKGYGYRNVEKNIANDENSIYQLGSITKQITAAVILKLQEEKKLSVNDKISKYFKNYPKGDSITIANLLSHTSGIYNYTANSAFMQKPVTEHQSRAAIMALFENKPLAFTPGSNYEYSNSNYMLLGYIIEDVTKMPYEKAVRKYIFNPAGMTNSGFDFVGLSHPKKTTGYFSLNTPSSYVDSSVSYAAGAAYATTGDLYKWHKALLTNKIINPTSVEAAYTPLKNKYGYGWIIDTITGKKLVSHTGGIYGFNTVIKRVPTDDACVILLSNVANNKMNEIANSLLNTIYYGAPVPVAKKVEHTSESLRQYVGEYKLREDLLVTITVLNGALHARPTNQSDKTLVPDGGDKFHDSENEDIRLRFQRDATGEVNGFKFQQNGADMFAPKIIPKLVKDILHMDSVLFNAFNNRDLNGMKQVFDTGMEFYHDKTGLTNYDDNIKAFTTTFALNNPPRRELIRNSVEIVPLGEFGALQTGEHRFCRVESGQVGCSIYKFVTVWKKTSEGWKASRLISYGH